MGFIIALVIALSVVIYLLWNNHQQLGKTQQQLRKTREALEQSDRLNRQQAEQMETLEQAHQIKVKALEHESEAKIHALEQANIEQATQLETAHIQQIASLQATHQAALQQRERSHQDALQHQEQSHQAHIRQLQSLMATPDSLDRTTTVPDAPVSSRSSGEIGYEGDGQTVSPSAATMEPKSQRNIDEFERARQQLLGLADSTALPFMGSLADFRQHPNPKIREILAQTLGKLATQNSAKASRRLLISLLGQLSHDPEATVRNQTVLALGQIPAVQVIPWLKKALRDVDSDVVKSASRALERRKSYRVKPKQKVVKKKVKPPQG